jgi:hypothetical protein
MRTSVVLLLLLGVAGGSLAADAARTIRQSELRAQPYADAAVVASVPADAGLAIQERKGGWYKVQAGGNTGWMRMTAVRMGTAGGTTGGGDTGLGSALKFMTTGRSGSSGVTAATGIKGLTPEDMVSARPDYRALQSLDRYAVTARDARKFAAKAHLASNAIPYPAASASHKSARPSGGTSSSGGGAFPW